MKKLQVRKWLIRGAMMILFFLAGWVGFYCHRSHNGSYHEVIQEGGISFAVWFPSDFEPRQIAPPRPPGNTRRGRYAPQTRLPKYFPLDLPLLTIDRWFIHESVQTVSGQGDMPRLYDLSTDGRTLIPAAKPNK